MKRDVYDGEPFGTLHHDADQSAPSNEVAFLHHNGLVVGDLAQQAALPEVLPT